MTRMLARSVEQQEGPLQGVLVYCDKFTGTWNEEKQQTMIEPDCWHCRMLTNIFVYPAAGTISLAAV